MKKSKKWIITIIIIIVIVIMALIGLMVYGIATGSNFSFGEQTEMLYEENFKDIKKIEVDITSYDVELKESNGSDLLVEITGSMKNKDKIKVEQLEDELKIYQDGSIICIGLCLYKETITIYVPEDYELEYIHESTSGSLKSEVALNNGKIKTTSGDIELATMITGSLSSTSGNIKISEGNNLEVSSTSGDINIDNVTDLQGSATSGDVTINELTNKVNFSTTSGEINLKKMNINEDSSLSATSGNINIGLEKEIFIDAKTKSGDIDINNTNNSPSLTITTTSGDITAK